MKKVVIGLVLVTAVFGSAVSAQQIDYSDLSQAEINILILQKLDQNAKDTRELREEMIGRIDHLGNEVDGKIDTLRNEMIGRIDTLRNEMIVRIDSLESRLDSFESRLDRLERRLDRLGHRLEVLMNWFVNAVIGLLASITLLVIGWVVTKLWGRGGGGAYAGNSGEDYKEVG